MLPLFPMAAKDSKGRINIAVRSNVARSVNVGSPGSVRKTESKQNVRIRQSGGRTEIVEVSEKKEVNP